jgi:hypothetical protein
MRHSLGGRLKRLPNKALQLTSHSAFQWTFSGFWH